MNQQHANQACFPVAILVDYIETPANRWQDGRWQVSGVVAGPGPQGGVSAAPVRASDGNRQWLWSGFDVELYRDDAASYYFNIVSDKPRIFVICGMNDDNCLQPLQVTLSYDEAASYMESDEIVESVAMPAELYRWVEEFVLEHYVPEKRKKRKRDNWKTPEHGHPHGH